MLVNVCYSFRGHGASSRLISWSGIDYLGTVLMMGVLCSFFLSSLLRGRSQACARALRGQGPR